MKFALLPMLAALSTLVMKDAAATPVAANVLIVSLEKGLVEPPAAK